MNKIESSKYEVPETDSEKDIQGKENLSFPMTVKREIEGKQGVSSPKDGGCSKQFSYSQKYFRIADGNLYSVFSPIQGRSYGMKPSFLFQQGCNVRESRGRGRRAANRGLKFHNFIPSESITSEKDDGCQEETWKVHAECRLQEEHGTKQIMVSQWSVSSDAPSSSSAQNSERPDSITAQTGDFKLDSAAQYSESSYSSLPLSASSQIQAANVSSQSLEANFQEVHDTVKLLDDTHGCDTASESKVNINDLSSPSSPDSNCSSVDSTKDKSADLSVTELLTRSSKKHRRKPVQTRRVVPYKKYLSLMEESESAPLDLSLKSRHRAHYVESLPQDDLLHYSFLAPTSVADPQQKPTCSNVAVKGHLATKLSQHKSPLREALEAPVHTASSSVLGSHASTVKQCPFMFVPSNKEMQAMSYMCPTTSSQSSIHEELEQCFPASSSSGSTLLAALQSKSGNRAGSLNLRKPSQRSLIKQKLEDTFRQNGFLVKTKQVSDGDATFCKFRQLRKYTRYYLKSWHNHLPEEVHKLWKGFLPPKTALPGSSVPDEKNDC